MLAHIHTSSTAGSEPQQTSAVPDRFGGTSKPLIGGSILPPEFQSTSTPRVGEMMIREGGTPERDEVETG